MLYVMFEQHMSAVFWLVYADPVKCYFNACGGKHLRGKKMVVKLWENLKAHNVLDFRRNVKKVHNDYFL